MNNDTRESVTVTDQHYRLTYYRQRKGRYVATVPQGELVVEYQQVHQLWGVELQMDNPIVRYRDKRWDSYEYEWIDNFYDNVDAACRAANHHYHGLISRADPDDVLYGLADSWMVVGQIYLQSNQSSREAYHEMEEAISRVMRMVRLSTIRLEQPNLHGDFNSPDTNWIPPMAQATNMRRNLWAEYRGLVGGVVTSVEVEGVHYDEAELLIGQHDEIVERHRQYHNLSREEVDTACLRNGITYLTGEHNG